MGRPSDCRLDEVSLAELEEAHRPGWSSRLFELEFAPVAVLNRLRAVDVSGTCRPARCTGGSCLHVVRRGRLRDTSSSGFLVLADARIRRQWTAARERQGWRILLRRSLAPKSKHVRASRLGQVDFGSQLRKALDAAFPVAAQLLTGPLAEELRQANVVRLFLGPCGVLGYLPLHACPVDEADRPLFPKNSPDRISLQ